MKAHRFLVLDGMRGIAAFAVLYLHAGLGFNLPHYMRHGYLAVDFFFALSGFVLAQAYDTRIAAGISFGAFARLRFVRLYPMLFAGALLAGPAYYLGNMPNPVEAGTLWLSIFFLLPFGLLFNQAAFLINEPVWSLFFEFAANGLYFREARGGGWRVVHWVGLCCCFTVLGFIVYRIHSVCYADFASQETFFLTIPRVGFSFMAGIAIWRLRLFKHVPRLPDYMAGVLLGLIFALPVAQPCWWYDDIALLLLPVLVALGAHARVHPALTKFWIFSGRISYPLYIIHEPLLRAAFRIGNALPPVYHTLYGPPLLGAGAAIILAWVLLRFYDEPLRAALARRRASTRIAPEA